MVEWLESVVTSGVASWTGFPMAILAGVLASATSCCNAGVVGAIAGFSGTAPAKSRRNCLVGGLFFMLGATLAFMVLGAVTGLFGKLLAMSVGLYWKLIVALLLVGFGLIQLKLIPINWPAFKPKVTQAPTGILSSLLFGLSVGGIATSCDFTCNPMISTMLGLVLLRGSVVWGAMILLCFAIGYTLLPAGLLVGAGFGLQALSGRLGRAVRMIQPIAGVVLILVGFYLLFSL